MAAKSQAASGVIEIPLDRALKDTNRPAICQISCAPILPVTALAFSLDGKLLFAGGYREIQVWDVVKGSLAHKITSPQFKGQIQVMALDTGGHTLAVGEGLPGREGAVHFLDTTTGKVTGTRLKAKDVVCALAFSTDGQWLAASGADPSIQIWSLAGKTNVALLKGHAERVTALSFSSNNFCLASASVDNNVLLWDTEDWRVAERLAQGNPVAAAAFSNSGEWLAWAGGSGTERWIRSRKMDYSGYGPSTNAPLTVAGGTTNTSSPASGGATLVAMSAAPTNSLPATNNPPATNATNSAKPAPPVKRPVTRPTLTYDCRPSLPQDLVWNVEGKRIFTACQDGSIRVLPANVGLPIALLANGTHWQYRVATDPDGQWLAAAGANGCVQLWNLRKLQLAATLMAVRPAGWCVLIPSGQYTASTGIEPVWLDARGQPVPLIATKGLKDAAKVQSALALEPEGKSK
jgi:WD40 repeat protein